MNNGWIKLHRSLLDWEWYDDINTRMVFLHILLSANHVQTKWRSLTIKKGEYKIDLRSLADEVGMGLQSLRTSLDKLKSTHEITIKTTNKYSVISVNNWSDYQRTNTQPNKQLTNNQHTTNTPTRGTKNVKNVKKSRSIQKNSKNSLVACTEKELKHISSIKGVDLETVRDIHEDMLLKIEDGIFQKKKYGTTVYYTLMNWVGKVASRKNKKRKDSFNGIEII